MSAAASVGVGGPLDDIGYTRLVAEQGASLPTGAGIGLVQSEANAGSNNFYPDTTLPEFAGKTFTQGSGAQATSTHATDVARAFYGNTTSTARGATQITLYTADDWLGDVFLRNFSNFVPRTSSARVANHSWVLGQGSQTANALQRMDYLVETDDFIQVAGVNNLQDGANAPRAVFANAMNVITVGLSNGQHSVGTTSGVAAPYVSGRTRPHLVAPSVGVGRTSFSTPYVAGTAAMLIEAAQDNPSWSNHTVNSSPGRLNRTLHSGETSETIRAILLAGADRTPPNGFAAGETYVVNTNDGLNSKYGAGQLDVYESYHILAAGEQNSRQAGNLNPIKLYGWDYVPSFTSNVPQTYRFSIPDGVSRTFAASLAWNLDINLQSFGGIQVDQNPIMRNLNLRLKNLDNGATIVSSLGTSDVMENLYLPTLGAGNYELMVEATGFVTPFTIEYALAWRFAPSSPPLAGDFNLDGRVGLVDLGILQSHYGQTTRAVWTDGDANGDGAVDYFDLQAFMQNYGVGAAVFPALGAESDGDAAPTAIPEPATVCVAAVVLAAVGGGIRRRRVLTTS